MIGNNFIAAIRSNNTYLQVMMGGKKNYIYLRARGGKFEFSASKPISVIGEAPLWSALVSEYPDLLPVLSAGTVFQRGLAQRAELLLNAPSVLESYEARVHERVYELNRTVVQHLDATVTTKKTPAILRPSFSSPTTWYDVRQNAMLPYMKDKVRISVRAFPSPFDDDAWTLVVDMPSCTPEEALETQRRIQNAVSDLASRGVRIGDVLNGSGVYVR